MTLEDMSSATGLRHRWVAACSGMGQDGADPSGLEAVHVSRFRARESKKAMPTNATSGPLFNYSSPSAALSVVFGSRLQQNLEGNGSPLYELTWSQWDMPAGPQICRQRASARRTSANGCIGWPTPLTHNRNRIGQASEKNLASKSTLDRFLRCWRAHWHSLTQNRDRRTTEGIAKTQVGMALDRKQGLG